MILLWILVGAMITIAVYVLLTVCKLDRQERLGKEKAEAFEKAKQRQFGKGSKDETRLS